MPGAPAGSRWSRGPAWLEEGSETSHAFVPESPHAGPTAPGATRPVRVQCSRIGIGPDAVGSVQPLCEKTRVGTACAAGAAERPRRTARGAAHRGDRGPMARTFDATCVPLPTGAGVPRAAGPWIRSNPTGLAPPLPARCAPSRLRNTLQCGGEPALFVSKEGRGLATGRLRPRVSG